MPKNTGVPRLSTKKQATKQELLDREALIVSLIANGVEKKAIFEEVATKYDLSPRSVERQYYYIIGEMAKEAEAARTELRGTLMARYDLIYKKALADDNLKSALDACNSQAKVGGLLERKTEDKGPELPKVLEFTERDDGEPLKVVPGGKA